MGCLNTCHAIATQITITHIIGIDDDDIGFLLCKRSMYDEKGNKYENLFLKKKPAGHGIRFGIDRAC